MKVSLVPFKIKKLKIISEWKRLLNLFERIKPYTSNLSQFLIVVAYTLIMPCLDTNNCGEWRENLIWTGRL